MPCSLLIILEKNAIFTDVFRTYLNISTNLQPLGKLILAFYKFHVINLILPFILSTRPFIAFTIFSCLLLLLQILCLFLCSAILGPGFSSMSFYSLNFILVSTCLQNSQDITFNFLTKPLGLARSTMASHRFAARSE